MSEHTPAPGEATEALEAAEAPEATEAPEVTDQEKARRAAHVILDGLSAVDPDQPDSEANVEAMELAFARLLEIEAIELLFDEDEEELELDVSPLMEGVLLVVRHLVGELAARTGSSPQDIVTGVRSHLDAG